ncbi:hypothetical protein [Fusobacterium ulcerans]|uniref:FMN-binding domain-containing protein n=1 Tax=Fusobacterium ulcerans 12-1B TaxID=457404 RepID=H1PQF7_9FUSO|nr:hypothetical protein [Fusobacterium ulcerans]EHO83632.1 hypothetical protein HMPREF0402_00650 [Fusobacterium ulcerans 12-1B]
MKKIIIAAALIISCASFAETPKKEKPVLEWSVQPQLGIIKGDYYKSEKRFRQGHLGTLEVVKKDGKIVLVEFNEMTRPNYYNRYFQNVSKRMSSYNFKMGEAKGAAWIQGVLKAEKQMMDEQRLTGDFDTVAGASNSIQQSMVPLAAELAPATEKPSKAKFYSIAEDLGKGITGRLKVVVEDGKIISCRYDEIFADSPEDIKLPRQKQYYRQSKYESVDFDEDSRIGFNIQMDELNDKVVATQNMLDLTGLPATEETGDYKKSGFTIRNTAWDNYLKLAEKLQTEMKKDKVIK